MISAFDATMVILLFDEKAAGPLDKQTRKPIEHCRERVTYLIETISKVRGARMIFPAPALAEFLVRVEPDKVSEYISQIERLRGCVVQPFDIRAAIEFAEMQRSVIYERRKRVAKTEVETRAKAKFDQQIVAISKAAGATTIYTDDGGLAAYATRANIEPIGISQLPLSPDKRQGLLPLEAPEPAAPYGGET